MRPVKTRSLSKQFIESVRSAMEHQGLSGNALSKRARVGQRSISRLLRGEQDPTLCMVESIARGLKLPALDLLSGKAAAKRPAKKSRK